MRLNGNAMYEDTFTPDHQQVELLQKVQRAAATMSWLRSESASLQEEVIQLRVQLAHKNEIIDALVEQNRMLREESAEEA